MWRTDRRMDKRTTLSLESLLRLKTDGFVSYLSCPVVLDCLLVYGVCSCTVELLIVSMLSQEFIDQQNSENNYRYFICTVTVNVLLFKCNWESFYLNLFGKVACELMSCGIIKRQPFYPWSILISNSFLS